jgi:hypothetical protein
MVATASPLASPPQASALALDPAPALDPATFQAKWTSSVLVASGIQVRLLSDQLAREGVSALTHHMATRGVVTMASGGALDAMKFYLYAVDQLQGDVYLVETLIDAPARAATFTAKCAGRGVNFGAFQRFFTDALASA